MDITDADIIRMKESLSGIQDPRRKWGNLRRKLIDMLVIALTTIIIGEYDFDAMEDWGLEREEWFWGFLELPNGIPDKDTFRRLFERLNPLVLTNILFQHNSHRYACVGLCTAAAFFVRHGRTDLAQVLLGTYGVDRTRAATAREPDKRDPENAGL
jgi:hypothetical protein